MEFSLVILFLLRWVERMSALAFAAYVMWYALRCFRASVVDVPRASRDSGTIKIELLGAKVGVRVPQFAAGIALTVAGLVVPCAVIFAALKVGDTYYYDSPRTTQRVSPQDNRDNLDELRNAIEILTDSDPDSDAIPPLKRVCERISKQTPDQTSSSAAASTCGLSNKGR
jgi:hypothetical protein